MARGGGGGAARLERGGAGAAGPGAQRRAHLPGGARREVSRRPAPGGAAEDGPEPAQVPGQQGARLGQEVHRIQGLMSGVQRQSEATAGAAT